MSNTLSFSNEYDSSGDYLDVRIIADAECLPATLARSWALVFRKRDYVTRRRFN